MCQLGNTLESILYPFMSTLGGCPVIELGNSSETGNRGCLQRRELSNLMPESIASFSVEETEEWVLSALYHLLLNMGMVER